MSNFCLDDLKVDGLDINVGLSYTGDEKTYKIALKDYYNDIQKKSDMIEMYEKNKDIHNYIVLVHSLKSSSKTVGAMKVSELAKKLEKAGNDNNLLLIHEETPKLLKMYRKFLEDLKPFIESQIVKVKKVFVTDDKLMSCVYDLLKSVHNFDMDGIDKNLSILNTYKMTEQDNNIFKEINSLAGDLEYDECEEKLKIWYKELKNSML